MDQLPPVTPRIAVIGLGYVGLPLAASFARRFDVIGFDIDVNRVAELNRGYDRTHEVTEDDLTAATKLTFSAESDALRDAQVYIVTTPTPVDAHKNPDLSAVLAATRTVASALAPTNIVIYESTVYPGATEEECVPVLESISHLNYNTDFFVGYSPERINPGDKSHRFETIIKVTSGSTVDAARYVDDLYGAVVNAGTHCASSIQVAEAAKVIENTQRDVNIALINEFALVFRRLGIDTHEVLEAAGTKWNFLRFTPGLVGGHCIGVDPYYLTHKAQAVGYQPELILAGRRLNDGMGAYVATQLVRTMITRGIDLRGARVLILGLTFKENTPDIRNTRVIDIYNDLRSYGMSVDVHDPWVDPLVAKKEYGFDIVGEPERDAYDGIILAVPHESILALGTDRIREFGRTGLHVLFDVKAALPMEDSDMRL